MKRLTQSSEVSRNLPRNLLGVLLALSLVSACSKGPDKAAEDKSKVGTETKTATVDGESKDKKDEVETKSSPIPVAENNTKNGAGSTSPNLPPKVKIDLNNVPNNTPMLSIAGKAITIGEYKRMLRIQQIQAGSVLSQDPMARARLLAEAKKRGINLSEDEKKRVLETARQEQGKSGKDFKQALKEAGATEEQFNKEVIDSGLIVKVSNAIIEESLLQELINRELLAQATISAEGEKSAVNKYSMLKHTKDYDVLKKQTNLDADALKDEIIKAELAKIQLVKLEKKVKINPADLQKIYDANKNSFKHQEQIRLSSILIAAPEQDFPNIPSMRTMVLKANPKLSGKELDATTAQALEQQRQKALILLGQAKAGSDFAKLANENSDDMRARVQKTGGDMGYVAKANLLKPLGDAVWKLKKGQVLEQLVKNELGYNIFKVTDKRPSGFVPMAEVKPLLEMKARQDKLQGVLGQWLNERKKAVRIEFSPQFVALAKGDAPAKSAAQ